MREELLGSGEDGAGGGGMRDKRERGRLDGRDRGKVFMWEASESGNG